MASIIAITAKSTTNAAIFKRAFLFIFFCICIFVLPFPTYTLSMFFSPKIPVGFTQRITMRIRKVNASENIA